MAFVLERLAFDPMHRREVFLAELDELSTWPAPEQSPINWFSAFVALDARGISDAELHEFGRRCVASQCVFVCAWGPGCDRVHDAFDEAFVDAEQAGENPPFLMSTWHDNESLDDALWFALSTATAIHIDDPASAPLVAITSSSHTAAAIREKASDLEAFYASVEADEST